MTAEPDFSALETLIATRLGHYPQGSWQPALRAELQKRGWRNDGAALAALAAELTTTPLAAPGWQDLLNVVAIGETRFLRDRAWFAQVERHALTTLIEQRRQFGLKRLRCWSAGCSTGEEAYTLALLLRDMLPDADEWLITILATDARGNALRHAEAGIYDHRQLRELSADQVARHFQPAASGKWLAAPELRRLVSFTPLNLADETEWQRVAGGGHDLILCRNVLMYMSPAQQRRIGAYLSETLAMGGWLAVSPAEAMADWYTPLQPLNTPDAILFHKAAVIAAAPAPPPVPTAKPTAKLAAALPSLPATAPAMVPDAASLLRLRRLADAGARAEAARQCRQLLAGMPHEAECWLLLAEISLELEDWEAAKEAARRASYLAPASALAHFLLANAFWRSGKAEPARRAMNTALRLTGPDPGNEPVLPQSEITLRHIHHAARLFLQRPVQAARQRHV